MTDLRTVLVTGGTGKLGQSLLAGFAGLGYAVAFTTRDAAAAEALRARCATLGAAAALSIQVDLALDDAPAVIATALEAAGFRPQVLVNNARNVAFLRPDSSGTMSRANWCGEFALGVVVPYELTLVLARAVGSRLNAVVNVASMYGVTAPNLRLYDDPALESPVNYGVVKAALIHLTKELAVRLAPSVRVNAVSFGGVAGRASEEFQRRYAVLCPTGGMLTDGDVFGPVRFLAEDDAAGMTGHNMVVDGGWTLW